MIKTRLHNRLDEYQIILPRVRMHSRVMQLFWCPGICCDVSENIQTAIKMKTSSQRLHHDVHRLSGQSHDTSIMLANMQQLCERIKMQLNCHVSFRRQVHRSYSLLSAQLASGRGVRTLICWFDDLFFPQMKQWACPRLLVLLLAVCNYGSKFKLLLYIMWKTTCMSP